MRDATTVYAIELSESKHEHEFETFMLNEIFPTVRKGLTRSGQITRLVLLQGNTTDRSHEYLWLVSGEDLINGGAARQKIRAIAICWFCHLPCRSTIAPLPTASPTT